MQLTVAIRSSLILVARSIDQDSILRALLLYVCMYVCMYVWTTIPFCEHSSRTYVCIHMYVFMYVCVFVHVCVYVSRDHDSILRALGLPDRGQRLIRPQHLPLLRRHPHRGSYDHSASSTHILIPSLNVVPFTTHLGLLRSHWGAANSCAPTSC